MKIGIMAGHLSRPTFEETLDAIQSYGFEAMQFGLSGAGLSDFPESVPPELCDRIRTETDARGIERAAVSGAFNMIHPDPAIRRNGLEGLRVLAESCGRMGAPLLSLCTGTRNLESMWRPHPDNDAPEAWEDLIAIMGEAARIAEDSGVLFGIETEVSNVVDTAMKARILLDEIGSPNLKIIMDGANFFHAGELLIMDRILEEAFDLLGPDIALAHAKDLDADGEAGHIAAGTGRLDYDLYLSLLKKSGYDGPIILHSLREDQAAGCRDFLREKLSKLS